MTSSYIPSSLRSILFTFRGCFSAPSFANFMALICGWILCQGSHTISRVIVAATAQGLGGKGHNAYYRFLSRAHWCTDEVGQVLFRLLLPVLPETIEAAVDDTLCHRTGPQLFGAGMHRDCAKSTYGGAGGRRIAFAFGHNWVTLSIWVPLPGGEGRGIALPVLFRLYRPKKRCPESKYRKRTDLASEMLAILCRWLPSDRRLDLVGDGEYACKTLVRTMPDAVVFTGPMMMKAALHAPLSAKDRDRPRGRGRPRIKGRRMRSPKQRSEKDKWISRTIRLYGSDVSIRLQTWTCLWPTVCGGKLVRVVMTRDPRKRWKDQAYFCTDAERTPEEILARYAHRWELEVTFQAAKQTLGLESPRNGWWRCAHGQRSNRYKAGPRPNGNRGKKAVERTVPIIFMVYGIVVVWFLRHGDADKEVARQRRAKPWYRQKRAPAYIDMLAALRRELWIGRINANPSLRPHRREIIDIWEGYANAA